MERCAVSAHGGWTVIVAAERMVFPNQQRVLDNLNDAVLLHGVSLRDSVHAGLRPPYSVDMSNG
eukprot:SAG31_NODE_1694_length_7509_cov_14.080432_5_plen_64_part_00